MNKLKFLTIAVMSTLFFSTTTIYAMNHTKSGYNNINNSSKILNDESKINENEDTNISGKICKTLRTMENKIKSLISELKFYTTRIIPRYTFSKYDCVGKKFKPVYETTNLDVRSVIENDIKNMFKHDGDFLNQIKTNFENAYNEYKATYSNFFNKSIKEKLRKEYIEKCREEVNRIKEYIIGEYMGDRIPDFYADGITNIPLEDSIYECSTFNAIENLFEDLKKNKETYEKFYKEQKDMGKITNKIQDQIIKNFKGIVEELNQKYKDLSMIGSNIYTLNYLLEELKKVQEKKDKDFLPPSEQLLLNKDKEMTKDLSKDVKELLKENNRIINKDTNITPDDILNYYKKISNLGEKIHKYAYVISKRVAKESYKSNFYLYLYKTSWVKKLIRENLKDNFKKNSKNNSKKKMFSFSLIPEETWQ